MVYKLVYTANWGIIWYLPPIKGTRKLHWMVGRQAASANHYCWCFRTSGELTTACCPWNRYEKMVGFFSISTVFFQGFFHQEYFFARGARNLQPNLLWSSVLVRTRCIIICVISLSQVWLCQVTSFLLIRYFLWAGSFFLSHEIDVRLLEDRSLEDRTVQHLRS